MAHYTLTAKRITNWPKHGTCKGTCIDGFTDNDGNFHQFIRETTVYNINVEEDRIEVNGKFMPVKYDSGFCYKLQKTQIKSNGLPEFFSHRGENKDGGELAGRFGANAWYKLICEHVTKHGKSI